MSRRDKINLLLQVRSGKVKLEALRLPKVFVFFNKEPGIFTRDKQPYTEAEYREFCRKVKERNDTPQYLPVPGNPKLKQDMVITVCYVAGKTIL